MLKVLMIDDNIADIFLMRKAFEDLSGDVYFEGVEAAEEALAYLGNRVAQADFPNLLIVDVNLVGNSGHDVVNMIRSDQCFGLIPVIAFSGSIVSADVAKMYAAGVNAYVEKRTGFDSFKTIAKSLFDFWGNVAQLPPIAEPGCSFE